MAPTNCVNLSPDDIHLVEMLTETRRLFQNVASGEPGSGKDIPIKRRDGSVFFADITAGIMHLAGRPYLVCNIRDITIRRLAEKKVMQPGADRSANRSAKSPRLQ